MGIGAYGVWGRWGLGQMGFGADGVRGRQCRSKLCTMQTWSMMNANVETNIVKRISALTTVLSGRNTLYLDNSWNLPQHLNEKLGNLELLQANLPHLSSPSSAAFCCTLSSAEWLPLQGKKNLNDSLIGSWGGPCNQSRGPLEKLFKTDKPSEAVERASDIAERASECWDVTTV